MALLFCDSFDHYVDTGETATNPEGFEQKWDTAATEPAISNTGRTNSCAYFTSSELIGKAVATADTNSATFFTGFAFKRDSGAVLANSRFLNFTTGASINQISLALGDENNKLQVRTGTSGATLLSESNSTFDFVGGFHYVEFSAKVHNTTGTFQVKVDGTTIPMTTNNDGVTTFNTGTSVGMSRMEWGHSGQIVGMKIDDLYICNDTAVTNATTNTFLGDVKVVCTFPILDGNYEQWTKSVTSGDPTSDSARLVDDPPSSSPCPNGDADYVSSTTNTQRSSFICTDISTIGDPKAVQVTMSARTDTNTRTGAVFLRIAATDFDGAGMLIGASAYSMLNSPGTTDGRRRVWDVNPNGNTAWTLAVLNNSEIGALVVA